MDNDCSFPGLVLQTDNTSAGATSQFHLHKERVSGRKKVNDSMLSILLQLFTLRQCVQTLFRLKGFLFFRLQSD